MGGVAEALMEDFNPRSPHGERRAGSSGTAGAEAISTHAPRTGSDWAAKCGWNSTSPFQPTLPARGATLCISRPTASGCNFNPRSPHGERRRADRHRQGDVAISTHAPRTGSDRACSCYHRLCIYFNPRSPHGERPARSRVCPYYTVFQPTLPARGATAQSNNSVDQNQRLCTKSIP